MRFTSPPNQQAYYAQVWDLVRQIPRGKVTTYGQIAKMLPPPQGVEINGQGRKGRKNDYWKKGWFLMKRAVSI